MTTAHPFRASRYTTGAIVLHWTIAALVLLQIGLGWAMSDLMLEGSQRQYIAFQLHKSFGITVLVLTVARVLWRLFNPPPPEPASVARWEAVLAGIVHKAFYVLLVAVPLAGWLMVTVSRIVIPTNLFFLAPWPNLPGFAGMTAENRAIWEGGAEQTHALLAWTMGVLVLLHVGGALKHHLADGRFVSRMTLGAGGDGPRRSFGHTTTALVTVAFVAVMVASAVVARRPSQDAAARTVSPDSAAVLGSGSVVAPDDRLAAADAPAEGDAAVPAWRVLPDSAVTFTFDYANAPMTGRFAAFDADIRFDPDRPEASRIAATIDLAGASVDGTEISPAILKGPDGFAVSGDGKARYEAQSIRREGGRYVAEGTLALRFVTLPVRLDFSVFMDGPNADVTGVARLDRTAFGIGVQSDPDARTVGREVTVDVTIRAERR